ncbi:MAG: (2Fe-2S)-binding protein, partial [Paraburkholderia nemoris]
RSCLLPAVAVAGKRITTIEGLSKDGRHPLQLAWVAEDVPQCGYCQSGQLMQAAAFLKDKPTVNDETIATAMSGNICRCGTYSRIRKAIKRAASGDPALAAVDMHECASACSSYVKNEEV